MNTTLRRACAYLMACLCAFMSYACNAAGGSSEPNDANDAPFTVTGTVVDTKGAPIAGAIIRAENPTGNNIHVDGKTDAKGKYTLKLTSIGGWVIYAWKTVVTEDGDTYHLRMAGATDADYEAFTPGAQPIIRNFKWKLSGPIPDRPQAADFSSGYFGGSLTFVNTSIDNNSGASAEMPEGTMVTVTLTPVAGAKYLDGTPATAVITKTFKIKVRVPSNPNFSIGDIPVAQYTVTARTNTGKVIWLGRNKIDASEHTAQADVFFYPPPALTNSSGSYESGIGVSAAVDFRYFMSQH